ncbi:MAG TPA: hypothetical protein VK658_04530 [Chryseolinea sp.]|nr:hypothetical protein [Chryseolinea sp.]
MQRLVDTTIFVLIAMAGASCLSTEKASCEFLHLLKDQPATNSSLRTNGAYHMIKPPYRISVDYKNGVPGKIITNPFLHAPFFFFEDGTVLHQLYIVTDSAEYADGIEFRPYSKRSFNNWGVYSISHDTVHAIIYITYDHKSRLTPRHQLLSHFKGIAQSDGTIKDWRMVDPFPSEALGYSTNEELLDKLEEPATLYFKRVPIKQWIDPNLAWIRKLPAKNKCKE